MYPTMSSSYYSFDITMKSAEALTIGNQKPISKNIFATISIENQGNKMNQQTSLCDPSNTHPTWNQKLLITMPMTANFMVIEVYYKKRSSDKLIGMAKIPTSDFVGNNNMPLNYLHCLSYRLRDRNGEPNGIINFSVSVSVKGKKLLLDSKNDHQSCYNYKNVTHEIQGFDNRENYYAPKQWLGSNSLLGDRRKSTAVVVGVPAAWYNSCHA